MKEGKDAVLWHALLQLRWRVQRHGCHRRPLNRILHEAVRLEEVPDNLDTRIQAAGLLQASALARLECKSRRLCRTAGIGGVILDGVAEAARSVGDGNGPITHRKQLVQSTRLKARGHQEDVAA